MSLTRSLSSSSSSLQGFQLLADDLTGFGHICGDVLAHIRDEITETKPLVVMGLRGPFEQDYAVQAGRSEAKQSALDWCVLTRHRPPRSLPSPPLPSHRIASIHFISS